MIFLKQYTTQVSGGRIIEIVRIPGLLEIVCGRENKLSLSSRFDNCGKRNPPTVTRKLFGRSKRSTRVRRAVLIHLPTMSQGTTFPRMIRCGDYHQIYAFTHQLDVRTSNHNFFFVC